MYTGEPLPYILLSRVGEYRIKGSVNELNRDELYVGQSVIIPNSDEIDSLNLSVAAAIGVYAFAGRK